VAAHSTTRALLASYSGSLYQVRRASDNATLNIGVIAATGVANAGAQDSFCANTSCLISIIYDQSGRGNHLTQAPPGGFQGPAPGGNDSLANAVAAPVTLNGNRAYGVFIAPGTGYRDNSTNGIATGDQPEGMYAIFNGQHFNNGCCFDYGNAETNSLDNGNGRMETIYFGNNTVWGFGSGNGPWIMADLENGLFSGANQRQNTADPSISHRFLTAIVKGEPNHWAIRGGNAQSGNLSTFYNGARPNVAGYNPMRKEGAIILGIGGDNSVGATGTFYEGAMTSGYPSDATENAVQANIVAAGYTKSVGFPTNGSTYRITNLASGKVLDAVNCGTANGTAVDQWASLGNTCQQWRFNSVGANKWTLTNVNANKVLDAVGCGQALGTAVNLWQSLGNLCQQWAVIPAGNGRYELVVENSGMVLDDANCGTANGTPARLWMWLNNTCQLWSIAP
jgi:hypothetical protein